MSEINCKLETSDVQLDMDTFNPYIELTYTTRLSLDDEMYLALAMHKVRVE